MRFADRRVAGKALGEAVAELTPSDPVVLGLPRGGIPVAFEVARALSCDLDVLVVRKIGVPHQPELAMGAVAEGGVVIRNEDVIGVASIDEASFRRVEEFEQHELQQRVDAYRSVVEAVDPKHRTAIVVDDGLATGSTALAAVAVLRKRDAAHVWLAVPVAPRDTTRLLERRADQVVVLHQPRYFGAVGAWYVDFNQTTDEEVRALLAESRLR